ncbi:unnamed protein product [Allacma fusca]|uniref:Uncharacterized protein n=1 Tax=Allacma fusca TaxID=39272 RepID=A0A8J2JML6_9HEXA|nr:unnamed protein product [Allacma fusca]
MKMQFRSLVLIALVNLGLVALTSSHGAGLGVIIPLLPIAAITGHAGLWGSGLTGAALLKLKAAAALGALFVLKRGHAGINVQIGHQGEGWGQGNGWGWRRRRSVDESSNDARGETTDLDMAQYDPSLDEVLQYDQLGCGLRLVCELSATPEGSLSEDEKLILELFGRDEKAPNPTKSSRGKLSYSYAALLGGSAKSGETCSKVYGRCPYTGHQIMQSLRDANV